LKLDCRNLACPEPVIKTKNSLESMNEGILDVTVNSISSIQNVKRFALNSGYEFNEKILDNGDVIISIVKGYECQIVPSSDNLLNKTIFIKDDKIGTGELGKTLIRGFLKSTLEFDKLPKNIIFVNRGVLLTAHNENSDVVEILKEFEKRGVKIYSCGLCLNSFNLEKNLKIGEIGNAYDTMNMLLNSEVISL
jgi:selenium metabolism protein YedF